MNPSIRILLLAAVLSDMSIGLSAGEKTFTPEQIAFYEKQVKPLLQSTCIKCHGGEKTKAGLKLTSREAVLKGGQQGASVNLEAPEKSLLLEMLTFKDEDHSMPPDGKLPPEKIEIFNQWVKMGAPFTPGEAPPAKVAGEPAEKPKITDWWCYHPIQRPAVPPVKDGAWLKSPIDAFVLSKLESKGLHPVAPAEKLALIRRVYYDLIGLPPTPSEVDAFLADNSPKAYENLIDKLLAMPQYGEKWGRHWLDIVRYAETNGYERDGNKPFAWRYRDYVIKSFNDDKPYDQFIKEQIAGDELDNVTPDSIIATGFYRLNIWDDEPADKKLARYDVLDGIVTTTSQGVLGMTLNCARCHDHKKDPLLQRDYYSMLAFFQDISDMHTTNITRDILTAEQQAEYDRRVREKASKEKQLEDQIHAIEREFQAALSGESKPAPDSPKNAALEILPDSRREGQVWSYTFKTPSDDWFKPEFMDGAWETGPGGFGTVGTPGAAVRTTWASSDIWMRKKFEVSSVPQQAYINVHHDEDVQVYVNGTLVYRVTGYISSYESILLPVGSIAFKAGTNVVAVHCHQTTGGQYVDVGFSTQPSAALPVPVTEGPQKATTPVAKAIRDKGEKLIGKAKRDQYFALVEEFNKSRKTSAENPGITAMAVFETGHNMPTKILMRGNPNLEGDEVKPGFPAILKPPAAVIPPAKSGAKTSGKRRVLADWLTSKDNQLTARVMMNRLWQHHFGRGIVRSSNDFGQLGELPTHPELLDWLASEFIARDWHIKSMHKLIMMSNAYLMSSKDDATALAKDPNNDLFWRFDMRRLNAEEIRDSILAVNGTLNLKQGGPSIFTEVPAAILHTSSRPDAVWGKSPPEEQARRSVYIHVKRSLVEPILNTFDVADTDSSCPVRFATTVPTQALTSLNSKFFNDQAALMAKRLKKEAGDKPEDQVKLALRLALSRTPNDSEVQRCVKLMSRLRQENQVSADKSLDYFCLMILNLNEFVYLD